MGLLLLFQSNGIHAYTARPPSPWPRRLFLTGAQYSIVIVSIKCLFEIMRKRWSVETGRLVYLTKIKQPTFRCIQPKIGLQVKLEISLLCVSFNIIYGQWFAISRRIDCIICPFWDTGLVGPVCTSSSTILFTSSTKINLR